MKKLKLHPVATAMASLMIVTLSIKSSAQSNSVDRAVTSPPSVAKLKSELSVGKTYYIAADKLNVRSSNSITEQNIVGRLSLNDQVEILDLRNDASPLVQIKIINSSSCQPNVAVELFVSKDYLSEKLVGPLPSKYFIIQNIASEKTRVYERCTTSPDCAHKMVMETDMVVGRPEEGTKEDPNAFKTWVGHARISEWIKFYQDGQKHYPPWYRAGQNINDIPKPISKGASKIASSRKWIINGEHGPTIYGAFGWYAAKVTPADPVEGLNYQWIHGTMGWGRDGAAAIELTRGFLVNLFSNPGSAGCTRLENRAIAYLRHLLPVGTDVYRVYAREATREKETVIGNSEVLPLPSYAQQFKKSYLWDYTLLTDGAQQSGGLTADSRTIYIQRIPFARGVNLLEYGSYAVDQYPNAMPLDYSQPAHSGKSGDRYSIDTKKQKGTTASNFHGYFLVDEGRFVDYQHPDQQKTNGAVHVGGLADFRKTVPAFLSTTGSFNIPEVRSVEQDNETTDIH